MNRRDVDSKKNNLPTPLESRTRPVRRGSYPYRVDKVPAQVYERLYEKPNIKPNVNQ